MLAIKIKMGRAKELLRLIKKINEDPNSVTIIICHYFQLGIDILVLIWIWFQVFANFEVFDTKNNEKLYQDDDPNTFSKALKRKAPESTDSDCSSVQSSDVETDARQPLSKKMKISSAGLSTSKHSNKNTSSDDDGQLSTNSQAESGNMTKRPAVNKFTVRNDHLFNFRTLFKIIFQIQIFTLIINLNNFQLNH